MAGSKPIHVISFGDLASVVSGAYIGYQEGKGNDISSTVETATKYGPAAATMAMHLFGSFVTKKIFSSVKGGIERGDLSIPNNEIKTGDYNISVDLDYMISPDWATKSPKSNHTMLKDMPQIERIAFESGLLARIKEREDQIEQNPHLLVSTAKAGTRAGIGTSLGYFIGRGLATIF